MIKLLMCRIKAVIEIHTYILHSAVSLWYKNNNNSNNNNYAGVLVVWFFPLLSGGDIVIWLFLSLYDQV